RRRDSRAAATTTSPVASSRCTAVTSTSGRCRKRLMLNDIIANLLNRGLPRSPRAQQLLAQLEGRSLAIEVGELARFHIASNGATLQITTGEGQADATLAGGPLSLLALAGAAPESVIQRGAVSISGDAQL